MPRMRFYARHGVLAQETATGATFYVDLRITLCDAGEALWHDKLDGTVNYADVYECLRQEMDVPSRLLEHAAARMAQTLFGRFGRIVRLTIRLTKEAPPIAGFEGDGVSVELEAEREPSPCG